MRSRYGFWTLALITMIVAAFAGSMTGWIIHWVRT